MAVLINFKICDNDKACSGMAVCPNGVFTWNEETKNIEINNKLCVNCGLCEKACMVNAIKVAKNEDEYLQIQKEIETDPRTINDLLVDRYGAKLFDKAMEANEEEISRKIDGKRPLIVELYNEDSIMCLLKSIPIKELANRFDIETRYRKVEVKTEDLLKKYDIKELPSLLFFKNEELVGKYEGYVLDDNRDILLEYIDSIK